MITLIPCPYCGAGADKIELVNRPYRPIGFPWTEGERELFYRCTACGFETAPGISAYNVLTHTTTTVDQAAAYALQRWQNRQTRYSMRKETFKDYPGQEEYEKKRAELIRQGKLKPWD